MAQVKITNHTRCSHQVLFANDEAFRPLATPIIKATFNIAPDGRLSFAEEQIPVNLGGEYVADPESSSYLFEPECAFTKVATDIVVLGEAVAPKPLTHLMVNLQVGAMQKKIGVIGDRQWIKQSFGYSASDVTPFERMPLLYENAFGGWDKRHDNISYHGFEARNTVGKGYYRADVPHVEGPMPLPNLEDPNSLIQAIEDKPAPVACGFTLPHWQPRAQYAGTYDAAWMAERNPLLPKDFDRRYFTAASPGLVADGYLRGNEVVRIQNMTKEGLLQFALPGARAPVCKFELHDRNEDLPTCLDTVIIDVKKMQLQLIWRSFLLLDQGAHDVETIDIFYG